MWRNLSILHPGIYHGHYKKPPFFEGWYYKMVSVDEKYRYAIIPGIILGNNGHAFIQVLDGTIGTSAYYRFPLESFWAAQDHFEIHIGPNRFSSQHISLQLDDGQGRVNGEIEMNGANPWPVSLSSPGVMGWFAWVPRMECYHGVLSFTHSLGGSLNINQQVIDFTNGSGYMEKDWGQAFPTAYIWFQSNHFDYPNNCITASVAIIPWLKRSFPGFIIGFWQDGKLYRFATYTGARIESLQVSQSRVTWVVEDRKYRLELCASRAQGAALLGPTRTAMGTRVDETLLSTVEVHLYSMQGDEIFSGIGRNAGLEAVGDLNSLLH
jgi:tocopherol cyclase